MRHSRSCFAAAAILLAAATPLLAQTSSRATGLKLSGDQPIQIESDKLEVRENDSVAVFSGNVSVVQGATQLKAGKMTVHYLRSAKASAPAPTTTSQASSQIERMEVDGKVYVKNDTQVATGDRGTFDMASEVMVLTGKQVVLTDGANVIVGCKLTVQMKSGQATLDGCGSGSGRVKMLVTPKSK
jgi:lipopolysaccharide export system protein LptA